MPAAPVAHRIGVAPDIGIGDPRGHAARHRRGAADRARRDYSAVELDCVAGQGLTGGEAVHGWVWCRADDGREGWVPQRNLLPVAG